MFDYRVPMTGEQLRKWRERLNLKQDEAGLLLDKSERTICYYETDERPIPFSVKVACFAFVHCPDLNYQIGAILSMRQSNGR
jgi:transcriptional regulator with XRE-family HTH domain